MRRSQISFLLTIAATLIFFLGLLGGWVLAEWARQGNPSTVRWLLGLGVLAAAVTAILLWLQRFLQIYFFHIKSFVTDAQLILESNPDRRLSPSGPRDLQALMTLINQYAERFAQLINERDEQVHQARADLEAERNVLAALIANLSDGVVVCNQDGRILLYNPQARDLLAPTNTPLHTKVGVEAPRDPTLSGSYIGLGRSIFGLLDRHTLTHSLRQLQNQHAPVHEEAKSAVMIAGGRQFITTASGGGLLRTQMTPLVTSEGSVNGFVLTLHDMTERLAASSRRDLLLQRLTERMRGGLGSIRAAIEMLVAFPTMPAEQRDRFQQVIGDEVQQLGAELDQTMRDFADDLRAQWHFEEIAGNDLLWAIEQYLMERGYSGVAVRIDGPERDNREKDNREAQDDERLWLRVDSYAVVHGLATAIQQLQGEYGVTAIAIRLQTRAPSATNHLHRRFATIDVEWSSESISTERWLAWKEEVTTVDAGDATLSLREVAERHGSEVWFQHDSASEVSYFRLLLPLVETPAAVRRAIETPSRTAIGSRPHYYDFDLFQQSNQQSELDEVRIDALTFTVFDTETTGLDPQRDEIVAIGAVRVLNGRLLRQEIFDQFIDPQRPIPRLATEIHGIDDSMVRDQPTITTILPRFARFTEETILVGHNVAFDLRMFEVKAEATAVSFTQPVLDTLLLSEVLMPDEENHALEAIAERLGVNVLGRHTALGDAFVTAEVFLRMIPLLKAKGLLTLGDIVIASKSTSMAQITY